MSLKKLRRKNMRTNILILVGFVTIMFLLAGCGGGTINNEYLGKLPGIAKKYAA